MTDVLTERHTPNVLPRGHSRDDFDFDYADGVAGPIRIAAVNVPSIPISIPAKVWCKRHGWEAELTPDAPITDAERVSADMDDKAAEAAGEVA